MDTALIQIQQNLESIKRTTQDENPMEFWLARDLMPMLGYSKWQAFLEVIEKGKNACKTSGQIVENHFLLAPVKSGYPQEIRINSPQVLDIPYLVRSSACPVRLFAGAGKK